MSRWLIIPDLQVPFHHPKALEHCLYVKKQFNISDDHILNVGDEVDQYFGGLWKKSPDMDMSAIEEIRSSIDELRRWYEAFPQMHLATSNHGSRWMRKASEAEIPSVMMRKYQEVIHAPPGWKWAKSWKVNAKYPFMIEHGDDWGGQHPQVQASIYNGCSTIMGHFHTIAEVSRIKTKGQDLWGMCAGSLIDYETLAFEYARKAKKKPQIGCGVVMDDGKWALWVPM